MRGGRDRDRTCDPYHVKSKGRGLFLICSVVSPAYNFQRTVQRHGFRFDGIGSCFLAV